MSLYFIFAFLQKVIESAVVISGFVLLLHFLEELLHFSGVLTLDLASFVFEGLFL